MKKALLLLWFTIFNFVSYGQLSSLPSNLSNINAFRQNSLTVTVNFPPSYIMPVVTAEIWQVTGNDGSRIFSITPTVTITGKVASIVLNAGQMSRMPLNPVLYVKLGNDYKLGAKLTVNYGLGVPVAASANVTIADIGEVKINLIGDAGQAQRYASIADSLAQLSKTYSQNSQSNASIAIAAKDSARYYSNVVSTSTNKINTLGVKSGYIAPTLTIDQLRAGKADTATIVTVKQGTRTRLFYYDPSDSSTPDDSAMVITYGIKRYKFPYTGYVEPEWFGVTEATSYANESAKMQRAINWMKSKGGGVLKLGNKQYTCNIKWSGGDNISIQGSNPSSSLIQSSNLNDFAIKIDYGYLSKGSFLRDFTITGTGQTDRLRHGIYFNCGSGPYMDNVVVENCGIGIFYNGTIDSHLNRPQLRGNYVGIYFTTVSGANATITDVNGQTLTVSDAFIDTHPSEHTITGGFFFANTFHYIVDNHSSFPANANIKLFGGSMQGSACGVVVNSNIGLLEQPMLWSGVWLENANSETQPQVFNGVTYKLQDLYMNGGQVIIDGSFVTKIEATNNAIVELNNCAFYGTYAGQLLSSNGGTFTGRGVKGYGTFLPYQFETGVNSSGVNALGFYTNPKTKLSSSFKPNKIFSTTNGVNAPTLSSFGTTQTKVSGGLIDGTCLNVVAANNEGIYAPIVLVQDKIYVSNMNIRSMDTTFTMNHTTTGGSHSFANSGFLVTPEWKSVVVIGRANSSGSDNALLYNQSGVSHTYQVSGWQILEFNNTSELYAFLKSSDFTVDQTFVANLSNASTTVPTKANLNSSYGIYPSGLIITYPSISGGTREYKKLSDSSTSDWKELIWSTGVSSLAL